MDGMMAYGHPESVVLRAEPEGKVSDSLGTEILAIVCVSLAVSLFELLRESGSQLTSLSLLYI